MATLFGKELTALKSESNWTLVKKLRFSEAQLAKNPTITIKSSKEGNLYAMIVIDSQCIAMTPDISTDYEVFDTIDPKSFRVLIFQDKEGELHKRFIGKSTSCPEDSE